MAADRPAATSTHATAELPVGSVVVERYVYTNPNGSSGVQWLAQVVTKDGSLAMIEACRTRRAALEVLRDA